MIKCDYKALDCYLNQNVSLTSHLLIELLCLVPATAVVDVCPDCPTADNLNDPIVMETANLSLQRFNTESRLANYFTLENITKASSQVRFQQTSHTQTHK